MFAFDTYNLLTSLIAAVVIQALFFIFAAAFRTDKVTDLSYSLSFVVLTAFLAVIDKASAPAQLSAAVFTVLWGLRLGGYLFLRILRTGRDERFDGIRESFLRFLGFWIMQAFVVWLVMLPVTILMSIDGTEEFGIAGAAGVLLWAAGFLIETISDLQKSRFKAKPENTGKWTSTGLWRYSRHPNYFGEILLWWGIFLIALPHLSGLAYIAVLGPVGITLFLLFVSGIPPTERKQDEKYGKYPGYREYKQSTSVLVPLPPKKARVHGS